MNPVLFLLGIIFYQWYSEVLNFDVPCIVEKGFGSSTLGSGSGSISSDSIIATIGVVLYYGGLKTNLVCNVSCWLWFSGI